MKRYRRASLAMAGKHSGRMIAAGVTVIAAALSFAACASPAANKPTATSTSAATQDPNAVLTVWVDSTRQPMAEAYQKAHPDVKMKIETYDGNANGATTLQTKISLFNRSNSGWPDVVFSTQVAEMSWLTSKQYDFPLDLQAAGLSPETIDGFAKGALAPCTVDGKLGCLRNDMAMNVTWFDTKLFKQFGYTVPTTWEEYGELGKKLGAEHPGYIIGTVGDSWGGDSYLWPSQCPVNQAVGPMHVKINGTDPKCTRVVEMLDPLIKNKTISTDTVFSSSFAKKQADKVLMLVGPAWYGGALFAKGAGIEKPAGEIGVGKPLVWADGTDTTGNVGGGLWIVSKHTQSTKNALDFATWVTTNEDNQGSSPGYPAYAPAAKVWLSKLLASKFYANDPTEVFTAAAGSVWDGWAYNSYSTYTPWTDKVVNKLNSGGSLADAMPAFTTELTNKAKAAGYTVDQ
jgi:ABC-type glycerol-3-phosphate transport system substrate-binding protein